MGANWLALDLHEEQRVIMEDYLQTVKIADDEWREYFQSTSTCFIAETTRAPHGFNTLIRFLFSGLSSSWLKIWLKMP